MADPRQLRLAANLMERALGSHHEVVVDEGACCITIVSHHAISAVVAAEGESASALIERMLRLVGPEAGVPGVSVTGVKET
jgi:hypothetical protein